MHAFISVVIRPIFWHFSWCQQENLESKSILQLSQICFQIQSVAHLERMRARPLLIALYLVSLFCCNLAIYCYDCEHTYSSNSLDEQCLEKMTGDSGKRKKRICAKWEQRCMVTLNTIAQPNHCQHCFVIPRTLVGASRTKKYIAYEFWKLRVRRGIRDLSGTVFVIDECYVLLTKVLFVHFGIIIILVKINVTLRDFINDIDV